MSRIIRLGSGMASDHLFPKALREFYEVEEWRNACAVLSAAHPEEWKDLIEILTVFRMLRTDIQPSGGGQSLLAKRIDRMFKARDWKVRQFNTAIKVDGVEIESPTHKVDCFKNFVAVELEWNNKTEFYDRDLNNFRLLFELRTVNVGIILTRCDELQDIFDALGRGASYGPTTTIFSKLKRKLDGGAGGGCPVLAIGMKKTLYLDDVTDPTLSASFEPMVRNARARRRGGAA